MFINNNIEFNFKEEKHKYKYLKKWVKFIKIQDHLVKINQILIACLKIKKIIKIIIIIIIDVKHA